MKGLILAGGHGTRLRPLTITGNKHMLPIANKPMLFYGLEHLRDAGVTDIGIVLGPIKEGVMKAVGDGSSFGVDATYIEQPEPKGIAHAISVSQKFIGDEPFVVHLGDNLLRYGIKKFVNAFRKSEFDAFIALCKVKNPQRFGVAEIKRNKIVRLIEKPKKPSSDLALIGVYFFKSVIFDSIKKLNPSWRNELEITEAIQNLIDWGYRVKAYRVKGWWKDTGRSEDLLEANQLILSDLKPINRGHIEEGVVITGKVSIDQGSIIRKDSKIRGPVIIGKNCQIGPNTYIGPYTAIGDNASIRGGEIENSIIMDNATLECEKRIVDSLIGKNANVISANKSLPKGCKLCLGDYTSVSI